MSEPLSVPDLGPAPGTGLAQARERLLACARAGLLRHAVDAPHGGAGDGFHELVAAHEALGRRSRDPGLLLAVNAHLWGSVFALQKFGSAEQQAAWIPKLLDGRAIGGHAITEPDAGSDVQGLAATAVEDGDGFRLNGRKRFITNAPLADLLVVYARLGAGGPLSAFLVQADDAGAGFLDGPVVQGCATASMGDVVLEDCRLPGTRLLGRAGAGATMIQLALELERAFVFAGLLGVMEWQLEKVTAWVRARPSGDGRLADVQAVAHRIAAMKLRLDTARLWIERCAALCEAGRRITLASAETKLYASEAFLDNSLDAVHLLGAAGLQGELPALVQDALAGRLLSGSSEIQKNIIAALLGLGGRR